MIEVVFTDVDGCFVPEAYDPLGSERHGEELEPFFAFYRAYDGPQIVLCTGRAWENTRGILARAGFLPKMRQAWPDCPVLCEHGIHIVVDPISGARTSLVDVMDQHGGLRSAARDVRAAADVIEGRLASVRQELEARVGRKVARVVLVKKQFCFALDLPLVQDTCERVDPTVWLAVVRATLDEILGQQLRQRLVVVSVSANAVDVSIPLGKADGVRYLLQKYGTSPGAAAYIGDSVADIQGMQSVRFACCPSNAVPQVKTYVETLGDRGYLSPLQSTDGEIDALRHLRGL